MSSRQVSRAQQIILGVLILDGATRYSQLMDEVRRYSSNLAAYKLPPTVDVAIAQLMASDIIRSGGDSRNPTYTLIDHETIPTHLPQDPHRQPAASRGTAIA